MMTFLHYPTVRSGDAIRGADNHLVVQLHRIIPLTTSRMLVITRDLAGNEYQDEYVFCIPPRLPGWYYRLLDAVSPVA